MKLFQIILVLSSFFLLNNCVGVAPEKVNINKIKKERKTAVFISGRGTNLKSIYRYSRKKKSKIEYGFL